MALRRTIKMLFEVEVGTAGLTQRDIQKRIDFMQTCMQSPVDFIRNYLAEHFDNVSTHVHISVGIGAVTLDQLAQSQEPVKVELDGPPLDTPHFFVSARGKARLLCSFCGNKRDHTIHIKGNVPTVKVADI